MGVVKLWPLLEPVRRTKSLPELKGEIIAIDLSAWVMGCKRVTVASKYRNVYLRTVFLRTLDLLKCGIRPVFVCDGCIPKVKFDKIRSRCKGRSFAKSGPIFRDRSQSDTTRVCRHLFECLGLPCLESEGEGEALCAFLNNEQFVDGCLTSDSDVLLYGARKVYRNYSKKKRVGHLEAYDAKDIQDKMHLDRRALVALALLLGCDYNQVGVPGVGAKTAVRMIREMQKENNDTLQRMLSWRTNQELQDLQDQMDTFNEEKHCNECLHIVVGHSKSECDLCGDNINVSEDLENCECSCHSFLQKFVSHEEELKVRQKALMDPNFPSQDVIEEFLIPTESKDSKTDIKWQEPNFGALQKFVSEHLHWTGHVLFKRLVPIFIQWKLNSSAFPCLEGFQPLRIIKKLQRNYQLLYEVEWSKPSDDIWTRDATYRCSVERDLFEKCFPGMVGLFEQSLLPAKPAKVNQTTISYISNRVTRSSLKRQGLTLSDIEGKRKEPDNSDDETESEQYKMSGRLSKVLVRAKKQKKSVLKLKAINSADTQTEEDVSPQIPTSSKSTNLTDVCSVTLERIPGIDGMKASVQNISVDKEKLDQNGRHSSCMDSEEMDCIEETKGKSSADSDMEDIPDRRNRKMETSQCIQECLQDVDIVDVKSKGLDSIGDGSKIRDMMMEGSSCMGSLEEASKSIDPNMDSMVECSKAIDLSMDSPMKGSKTTNPVVDFMVEASKAKDLTMDSPVDGSKTTDPMMDSMMKDSKTTNRIMDSMVKGSKATDLTTNSSVEGSKTTMLDSMVEGEKLQTSAMDFMLKGSKSMDKMMDSVAEDSAGNPGLKYDA